MHTPLHYCAQISALSYDESNSSHASIHPGLPSSSVDDSGRLPYKSSLDLKRFQKLVEKTGAPLLADKPSQRGQERAGVRGPGSGLSRAPGGSDDGGSLAGMSELSSIRGDEGHAGGNTTMDSEMSSVYDSFKTAECASLSSLPRHAGTVPGQQQGRPLSGHPSQPGALPHEQRGVSSQHPPHPSQKQGVPGQQGTLSGQPPQQQGSLPSQHTTLPGHPLHVSRKMTSQHPSRGDVTSTAGGVGNEKANRIHTDLTKLGEASECLNLKLVLKLRYCRVEVLE